VASFTLNQAREAIYQKWVDDWGVTTPFTFASEKYTAPTDSPWARVTVIEEAGEQDSLGSDGCRKFLRRGRVLIQLYDIVDNGLRDLDILATTARDIFEGTRFSGIWFTNVDVRETGSDGEWYQFVVDAPFSYQDTK